MRKVKITVLKKEFHSDLAEQYLSDGENVGACSILEVGDSFIFEGGA